MSAKPVSILVTLVALFALVAASCGSSDSSDSEASDSGASSSDSSEVASLESTETAEAEASATPVSDDELNDMLNDAVLEFSACVRDAGVTDFPDLDASRITDTDSFLFEVEASGVDLDDLEVSQAIGGCLSVLDEVVQVQDGPTAEETAALEEAALGIMQCIRDNGYPDVPDLDLSNGFDVDIVLQLVPYVDVTDTVFQGVAGDCIAASPVDFDGRDSLASLLQSD